MLSQLGWDTGHTGQTPDLNPASIGIRNCPQKTARSYCQLDPRSTETRFYFALYLSLTVSGICSMHYWVVLSLNDIYCLDLSKDSFDFDPSWHELSLHTPYLEVVSECCSCPGQVSCPPHHLVGVPNPLLQASEAGNLSTHPLDLSRVSPQNNWKPKSAMSL